MKTTYLDIVAKLEIVDPMDRQEFFNKEDDDDHAMAVAGLKQAIYQL